ncbi:Ribosomal_S6 domain-containing protein [Cephalotus follicularis]|uniref:Ribosomal_S6 domain-containing protein n=1 Tax=Cephalotus follicularis TaxID=3775 RepID=A0A1Q3BUT0_CEPFO|nr:Ribosomal_S6 domain-containing protein [Cephalotus follicularis]
MESLLHSSTSATHHLLTPNLPKFTVSINQNSLSNGFSFSSSSSFRLSRGKSLIVEATKGDKKKKKEDTHSFVPNPDEVTGFFPEAVLLKQKKVQEDGKLLPEFANEEEEELFDFLNLTLQSDLNVDRMRHYEVVYLIHEKYDEEVESVNDKIQDFLREKKGKIWRLNDWGLRRLAYKIQKAKNAHYILMNFELEARWINDFKSLLDKDERVIRHLVIKRDEAITEDCPPPLEFHTLRGGMDDNDDADDKEEDIEYDDEDYGEDLHGEAEMDGYNDDDDDVEDGPIIFIKSESEARRKV